MTNGDMYLGKLCRYASECPAYKGKNKKIPVPVYILKNVFCNRGIKGWKNCKRFQLLEQNEEVKSTTTPYSL